MTCTSDSDVEMEDSDTPPMTQLRGTELLSNFECKLLDAGISERHDEGNKDDSLEPGRSHGESLDEDSNENAAENATENPFKNSVEDLDDDPVNKSGSKKEKNNRDCERLIIRFLDEDQGYTDPPNRGDRMTDQVH
ncbi:10094_t:CDS:1, partial [Paraglomus brasilianum]